MRYGDINVSPISAEHFFGAQKLGMHEKGGQLGGGVCTQTPSLGRMALDGFGTSSLKM